MKKYYKRINDLDIELCKSNREYIMVHQWAKDNSFRWGIATFDYDKENYYYLRTYSTFDSKKVDWYDFGCLVNLGYKWIKELGWND